MLGQMQDWPLLVHKIIDHAAQQFGDREVVVDQGLVTSRSPADLDAFCGKLIEEFGEGAHAGQCRSA